MHGELELGLSESQFNYLSETICSRIFLRATPQEKPVGIVLGGQPASGKSLLIEQILNSNSNLTFIVINGDELRSFHPKHNEYNTLYGREAVNFTQPFSNALVKLILDKAIDGRYNVIIEGTMRNPQIPLQTIQKFKNAAYFSEAHVLAVNEKQSLLGIYKRYESQKKLKEFGRFSPTDIHEAACEGLLSSVDELYSQKSPNRIVIYNLGAKKILSEYSLDIDEWSNEILPSVIINKERNRSWPPEEKIDYVVGWKNVITSRKNREASFDPIPERMFLEAYNNFVRSYYMHQLYIKRLNA